MMLKILPAIAFSVVALSIPKVEAMELRNDRLGTRIYASSGGHFEMTFGDIVRISLAVVTGNKSA